MHIPDIMLSPSTSVAATVAMLPIWTLAARRVRSTLGMRQIPLLSLGAAFCFTVMMFNIPALGGTTAHPVAGTLLAILLGPWAAVIGISVALTIQAIYFGDGGLLALGANCFTMAFALPFVGYSIYRLLAIRLPASSAARAVTGAIGAYIGVNAAAALVGVLLGIQPLLFHEPNGHALYFPFGLRITLPAMLSTHLLIAGPAEAVVTWLAVRYLQIAGYPLYSEQKMAKDGDKPAVFAESGRRKHKAKLENLTIGLLALVALSPLGLLAKGDAWGEWDAAGIEAQVKKVEGSGYVPQGIARAEEHSYKGIRGLQDYASNEGKNKFGYFGACLLGVGSIIGLLMLGGRLLVGNTGQSPLSDKSSDANSSDDEPRGGSGGPHSGSRPSVEQTDSAHRELPVWLRASTNPPSDFADSESPDGKRPNGKKSNQYLERTLAGLAHKASVTLLGENNARRSGYLQQLDPRGKVIGLLALIVVVTNLHRLAVLLALYAFALLLACLSHLSLPTLLKRVWFAVPLFVGALALPATLNVVTPGVSLITLWTHPFISVTESGLLLAFSLLLRVGIAVTFAAILTLSTRWNDLLRALRILFVPRLFISVLAMTYRYLAVLMQAADDQFVARRSRTVGHSDNARGRRFVGASMGALFGKTLALSEEVYSAMLSRGFDGDMRTLARLRWRMTDSLWTLLIILVTSLCIGGEHVH